jgi:hypothetical protein
MGPIGPPSATASGTRPSHSATCRAAGHRPDPAPGPPRRPRRPGQHGRPAALQRTPRRRRGGAPAGSGHQARHQGQAHRHQGQPRDAASVACRPPAPAPSRPAQASGAAGGPAVPPAGGRAAHSRSTRHSGPAPSPAAGLCHRGQRSGRQAQGRRQLHRGRPARGDQQACRRRGQALGCGQQTAQRRAAGVPPGRCRNGRACRRAGAGSGSSPERQWLGFRRRPAGACVWASAAR